MDGLTLLLVAFPPFFSKQTVESVTGLTAIFPLNSSCYYIFFVRRFQPEIVGSN